MPKSQLEDKSNKKKLKKTEKCIGSMEYDMISLDEPEVKKKKNRRKKKKIKEFDEGSMQMDEKLEKEDGLLNLKSKKSKRLKEDQNELDLNLDSYPEVKKRKKCKNKDEEEEYDYGNDSSDFEDATMEEVFKITKNVEASRPHPPDINLKYTPVDVCFHPEKNFLAVATAAGSCLIYKYDRKTTERVCRIKTHKDGCTKISYCSSGKKIFVLGASKSVAIINSETYKVHKRIKTNSTSICSFCYIDDNTFAVGDEEGKVSIWDIKKSECIHEFEIGEEEVTDLVTDERSKYLVGSCADGSITALELGKNKVVFESEHLKMMFTSMCVLNEDEWHIKQTKLIVGTDKGKMVVFNYGDFFLDSFISCEQGPIDNLMPISDREFLAAYEDGTIRLISILPTCFHGIIASANSKFPVDNMSVSNDFNMLVSCSADDKVKFWNIENIKRIKEPKNTTRNRKGKIMFRRRNKVFWSDRKRSLTQFMGNLGYGETFKQQKLPDFINGAD